MAKFRPIGNILKSLATNKVFGFCLRIDLALGKILKNVYAIGQIFIVVNDQKLNKDSCLRVTLN